MLARVELPELGASSDWAASFSSAPWYAGAERQAGVQPEVERIWSDPTTAVSSINQPRSVGLEAPAAGAEEGPARCCPGQSPSSFRQRLRSRCRRPSSPSSGTMRLGSSASASGSEARSTDARMSYSRPLAPVTRTLFMSRRAAQAPWSRRRAQAPHQPPCAMNRRASASSPCAGGARPSCRNALPPLRDLPSLASAQDSIPGIPLGLLRPDWPLPQPEGISLGHHGRD
jgi:hypothetical protein